MDPLFRSVAIVGVGLMGGSLGLALKSRHAAGRVVGIDRSAELLDRAQQRGAIDVGDTNLTAIAQSDAVFFAAPVDAIPALLAAAHPYMASSALVSDLGSVKTRIVAEGARLYGSRFVGGHPMAGSEANGIEAARAALFEDAAWAVTPHEEPSPASEQLQEMIRRLGGRPILITPGEHDRLAALISHLPHLLSFAFARAVETDPASALAVSLAGGSYRDLMRVSASDRSLWRAILNENSALVANALESYQSALTDIFRAYVGQRTVGEGENGEQ